MAWTEISERSNNRGSTSRAKELIRNMKEEIMELCEISEEMEDTYGERYGERYDGHDRGYDNYGERGRSVRRYPRY